MAKGSKGGKSSASSATRKKQAAKAAAKKAGGDAEGGGPADGLPPPPGAPGGPPPKGKGPGPQRGQKKDKKKNKKEPKKKVFIPPPKPPQGLPDPLDTLGLASQLPGDLVVLLRKAGKKDVVTRQRALEGLQSWIQDAIRASEKLNAGDEGQAEQQDAGGDMPELDADEAGDAAEKEAALLMMLPCWVSASSWPCASNRGDSGRGTGATRSHSFPSLCRIHHATRH